MGYIELICIAGFVFMTFILCLLTHKKTVITPELIFASCFMPQIVYALFYVEKWDLVLSGETVAVYIVGIFFFWMISLIIRILLEKSRCEVSHGNIVKTIVIKRWKLMLAAVFQICSIYLMIEALYSVTHAPNLSTAIDVYTMNSKDNGLAVPFLPGKMNLFSYLSGFVWIYYLIHSIVFGYKTHSFLIVANLLLSVVSNMLTGSRGGVIQIALAGVYMFFLLWGEKNNWRKKVEFKTCIKIALGAIFIILLFKPTLSLLGRSTAFESSSDYIALYLSAELKNLNTKIIQEKIGFRDITQWTTMNASISRILGWIGVNGTKQFANADTYMFYNGIPFGNVYTIFLPFIMDMGYFGLLFFESVMAFVCQISFNCATKANNGLYCMELSKVIYSYILVQVTFSFFSNWFFDAVISTGFVWCLIVWTCYRFFLENQINNKHIVRLFGKIALKY